MKARTFEGPDGTKYVEYRCPGCESFADSYLTRHHVPYNEVGAWTFNRDLERPTLSPSILSNAGSISHMVPICHHFVQDGRIQYLSDCTHAMAGQTIDLPEIEEATLS